MYIRALCDPHDFAPQRFKGGSESHASSSTGCTSSGNAHILPRSHAHTFLVSHLRTNPSTQANLNYDSIRHRTATQTPSCAAWFAVANSIPCSFVSVCMWVCVSGCVCVCFWGCIYFQLFGVCACFVACSCVHILCVFGNAVKSRLMCRHRKNVFRFLIASALSISG